MGHGSLFSEKEVAVSPVASMTLLRQVTQEPLRDTFRQLTTPRD